MFLKNFSLKALSAALILASASGAVFAKGYKGEACPQPPMLKTGFYVGAQAGYESWKVRKSVNSAVPGFFTATSSDTYAANGWLGGLMLGHGAMMSDWFYLGGEIFANWNNANYTESRSYTYAPTAFAFSGSGKFSVDNSYGISLLPGVKISEGTMPYIRLGWNWANLKNTEGPGAIAGSALPASSKNVTSNGFVFGVGTEMLLVDNWSARGEYNHTWYNDFFNACNHMPSDNQFTVGLLYHFG
jgi:outer membrane autotransporter protein